MMNIRFGLAASMLTVALLAAGCGGSGGSDSGPVSVATVNLPPVAVTTALASAIASQPLAFSSGVPDFGTTGTPTTVTFSGNSTAPTFAIAAGANTATGDLTIGSCIFTVKTSTFTAPSPLVQGAVIRVEPCTLKVQTAGTTADGSQVDKPVTLVLRNVESIPRALPIRLLANGDVVINGTVAGKVTLGAATGATGGA